MEFGLSEEQRLLQASVSGFLEKASELDVVRKIAEGDQSARDVLQEGIDSLGLAGVMIPEDFGGLGMTLLDAALVEEMLGRYVTPQGFLSNQMAVAGLLASGTQEQKETWLPKIAEGSVQFGIGIAEQTGAREGAGLDEKDGKLTGRALFVTEADKASQFIVADRSGRLHLVIGDAGGLSRKKLSTIDVTRSVGELVFDSVAAEALLTENVAGAAAQKMLAVGRVLQAADTLGAAQRMIEKAVAYSLERKQFNRVIGSFQAVKHMCAEMAAELEPCRSLMWFAAHAYDAEPDQVALMAAHAKSHVAEVGKFVARTATEVHGGIGFTDVLGLHFWFKRIGLNRQMFGSPETARQDAARLQGWV
ncbi:MAG: acyl-CoA dehydrogenase [Alphaproteobacteria bacterium]|nr:MAG: acyl-CoA dehydrogenase [Alphaproteobacteria bacterium]